MFGEWTEEEDSDNDDDDEDGSVDFVDDNEDFIPLVEHDDDKIDVERWSNLPKKLTLVLL